MTLKMINSYKVWGLVLWVENWSKNRLILLAICTLILGISLILTSFDIHILFSGGVTLSKFHTFIENNFASKFFLFASIICEIYIVTYGEY
tara:strand:+ start:420 stop:692 length:273 start_codon:yes stop_codon:yes gene_type:complete